MKPVRQKQSSRGVLEKGALKIHRKTPVTESLFQKSYRPQKSFFTEQLWWLLPRRVKLKPINHPQLTGDAVCTSFLKLATSKVLRTIDLCKKLLTNLIVSSQKSSY